MTSMVAIIKYNAGNIASVKNAVERLNHQCVITDNEVEIRRADKVIFPGVGEASSAMEYLKERKLDAVIKSLEPFWEYAWVCNCCAGIRKREIPAAWVSLILW